MNVLLDTNVLLDVAMARKPFDGPACEVIDAAQDGRVSAWVAWHTLSDVYYIFGTEVDDSEARSFIGNLLAFVEVASGNTELARRALTMVFRDYEDALVSACALSCGAELIVTRNGRHYSRSPVPAVLPRQLLARL